MSRHSSRNRRQGRAATAAEARRQQRRAATPPRLRLLADVGIGTAAAAAAGFLTWGPGHGTPTAIVIVAALAAAVAITWRVASRFVVTAVVLVVWLLAVPVITWLFAAVTPTLNVEGRMGALALYGLLLAVLSHRTSRGVPALTLGIALGVVTAVAAGTYALGIPGGVWLAYLTGLGVIVVRGPAGEWLADTIDQAQDWRATRKHRTVDVARWKTHDAPEARTARALQQLPAGYIVINDRTIPGSVDDAATIDHIVTGPVGVTVLGSLYVDGQPLHVDPNGTLRSGRRSLDAELRECSWHAQVVHARTSLDAHAVLVIHGAPVEPMTIGLWEHHGDNDESLVGAVTVLPDNTEFIVNTCTSPAAGDDDGFAPTEWSAATTRRYARRIARAFPAGRIRRPSSLADRTLAADLWHSQSTRTGVLADPETADADRPHRGNDHPVSTPTAATVGEPTTTLPDQPGPAVADQPEHREYAWDGGPEKDDVARDHLETIVERSADLPVGTTVNALRPDGMLIGWVVIGEPYLHADGPMAVVDIADPDDWATAQRAGRDPDYYLAEPLAHLMPTEPTDRT